MSEVCRDFGISRKTGYKIFNRHKDEGLEALTDRSRRPVRYSNPLPGPGEAMIVRFKKEMPHLGGRRAKSASFWYANSPVTCAFLAGARCMRFWIGTHL